MSGALHKETNYGKPRNQGKKTYVHVRVPVASLKSEDDIALIVDPAIRKAVLAKAQQFQLDLSKCETGEDWPLLVGRDGKRIPIRKVRVRRTLEVTPVGKGERQRFVQPGSNHHVEVFAQVDGRGRDVRWDSLPVSLLVTAARARKQAAVVNRSYQEAEDYTFKFSLMGGDTVKLHKDCNHATGRCCPGIYRLRTIAENGQLSFVSVNDARLKKDIQLAKQWWSPGADALRRLDCRKVMVDLLGRVHPAND
jgi:hypothetical protein